MITSHTLKLGGYHPFVPFSLALMHQSNSTKRIVSLTNDTATIISWTKQITVQHSQTENCTNSTVAAVRLLSDICNIQGTHLLPSVLCQRIPSPTSTTFRQVMAIVAATSPILRLIHRRSLRTSRRMASDEQ
jgi:hypothetical protein